MRTKTKTKNGVVVFLDALGVSRYDQDKCDEFIEKKYRIQNDLKNISKKWGIKFEKDLGKVLLEPNIASFQDSVILWWPKQEENSIDFLLGAGNVVTAFLHLAIGERIFFRGAMSVGEYIYDESPSNVTIIGKALFEAHDYHGITEWIGVIQTPSFEQEYFEHLKIFADEDSKTLKAKIDAYQVMKKFETIFTPYNVPLRKEINEVGPVTKKKFFAVSWPQLTYQIEAHGEGLPFLNILQEESQRPENTKYKSKYDNSLDFAEWYKNSGKFYPPPK